VAACGHFKDNLKKVYEAEKKIHELTKATTPAPVLKPFDNATCEDDTN